MATVGAGRVPARRRTRARRQHRPSDVTESVIDELQQYRRSRHGKAISVHGTDQQLTSRSTRSNNLQLQRSQESSPSSRRTSTQISQAISEADDDDEGGQKVIQRLETLSKARIQELEQFQARALLLMFVVFIPIAGVVWYFLRLASPPLIIIIIIFTTIGDLDLDRFCNTRPVLVGIMVLAGCGLTGYFTIRTSIALWPCFICAIYAAIHYVVGVVRLCIGENSLKAPPPGWSWLAVIGFNFATCGWGVDELTNPVIRPAIVAIFGVAVLTSLYKTGNGEHERDPTVLLILVLYTYTFALGVSYIVAVFALQDSCDDFSLLNFCFEHGDKNGVRHNGVLAAGIVYIVLVPIVYLFRRKFRGFLSKILRRKKRNQAGLALGTLFPVASDFNADYTKVGAELYFRSVSLDEIIALLEEHRGSHPMIKNSKEGYDISRPAKLHKVDYFVCMHQGSLTNVNVPVLQLAQEKFVDKFGREPTFWINEFCVDPRDMWERQVMYTPIFAGGCKRALLVLSKELFGQLNSMVALYLTLAMQEDLSKIELITATPTSTTRVGASDTVEKVIRECVTGFDVRRCTCTDSRQETFFREAIDRAGGHTVFSKEIIDGMLLLLNHHVGNEAQVDLKKALRSINKIVPGTSNENAVKPPELDRSRITVLENLGFGAFGIVKKALYEPPDRSVPEHQVALKLLHEDATEDEEIDFAREAIVTAQFDHPNVIKLVGVVTIGSPTMIVLQFCAQGSLKDVLTGLQVSPQSRGGGIELILISFCTQIAAGMDYLSGRKFIHRDLAARNVLVDAAGKAKIADFGLTRQVASSSYRGNNKEALPMRWAAEEVIREYKYTEMSDVWSFGVTCVEIFQLGGIPYGNWTNAEVAQRVLVDGYRLQRPSRCPEDIWNMILIKCFLTDPQERPGFHTIHNYLDGYEYADPHISAGVGERQPVGQKLMALKSDVVGSKAKSGSTDDMSVLRNKALAAYGRSNTLTNQGMIEVVADSVPPSPAPVFGTMYSISPVVSPAVSERSRSFSDSLETGQLQPTSWTRAAETDEPAPGFLPPPPLFTFGQQSEEIKPTRETADYDILAGPVELDQVPPPIPRRAPMATNAPHRDSISLYNRSVPMLSQEETTESDFIPPLPMIPPREPSITIHPDGLIMPTPHQHLRSGSAKRYTLDNESTL